MNIASFWTVAFLVWVVSSLLASPFIVFSLVKGAGLYDNQRLLQLSCALLALLIIALRAISGALRPMPWQRPIAVLLGLFFLLGLASGVAAHSPRHALLEWANLLSVLGMSWVIAEEVKARGEVLVDRLLQGVGLACSAYLLLEILVYLSLLRAGVQPTPRQLIVGYDNYRFFNHAQTISLPLLGLLSVRMHERGRRLFWWGVTALWWMLLFVGLGRGTLVGLIAGMAITWFMLRNAAIPWCRTMLWTGLLGLAAYLLFYVLVPVLLGMAPFGLFSSGLERTVDNPASGRLPLWARAWELILTNPWLGAGPAHFAHYARDIPSGAAHPHDWPLQFGSEWGVPALFLLVVAIFLAMRSLWRRRDLTTLRDQNTLVAWLVLGWAILVDGLVSGLIVIPVSVLWIGLYVGCAWGWVASRVPELETATLRPSRLQRIAVAAPALALVGVLLYTAWPDLQGLSTRQPVDPQNPVYWPRLWKEGRF